MSIINNTLLLGSGDEGYNLTRSLRFRSSASAYLNRTPASAGNRKTWTWSGWVKRGSLSSAQAVFSAWDGSANEQGAIRFEADNTIKLYTGGTTGNLGNAYTTAVFRDPSAWYHIVGVIDTTQATAANRIKLYVNGVQQSLTIGTTAPQNMDGQVNATIVHRTGSLSGSSYFDGYLAEVNFIDGQALTPSSFGSFNTLTGVWQPAQYTGTYGTNGFELQFTDNSGATATTIGKDFSGNGNNWTPNNISVTAGVTYDSMTDVPTLTSATAANFAVLNPILQNSWWAAPNRGTITNANLRISGSSGSAFSTFDVATTGKWYLELNITSYNNGVINPSSIIVSARSRSTFEISYLASGTKNINGANTAYGASWTTGDIIGVAIDKANNQVTFYKNNVSQGAITNTFPSEAVLVGYYCETGASDTIDFNFGQRPFSYTPPTGFVALNTFNLPTSTIVKGNTVMDATLYTGTLLSNSITNTAAFKPDLVWVKSRSAATTNKLTDSVRGVTKGLSSNSTDAESTDTQGLTAFNTNGFTVGTNTDYNNLAATYVAWQWQAGQGTTSSNTSGSITSTVSVNASAGFSVVTYTGTGVAATVGHGLGVAPSWIIVKARSAVQDWRVYTVTVGNTGVLNLNDTGAAVTGQSGFWNNTSPTSSVFSLGTAASTNGNGTTYVAYCWASIAGFSAFGSYTANGVADGPFIYTGFRPKFIMVKNYEANNTNWTMLDTSRDTYNGMQNVLLAESSAAETTGSTPPYCDALSNGFKLRSGNAYMNYSTTKYIYMAFAENPFKNALAR